METLKFITQTTNYKDNELSLIAERITHLPPMKVKRDLNAKFTVYNVIEEIDLFARGGTTVSREEERVGGSFAFNQGRSSAHVFGPRVGNYIKKRF